VEQFQQIGRPRLTGRHGDGDNIGTAIGLWLAPGLPAAQLMVTTIGPRVGNSHVADIPATNRLILALVAEKGASLIDIAALVSNDDG
jgi:hypothetical protein